MEVGVASRRMLTLEEANNLAFPQLAKVIRELLKDAESDSWGGAEKARIEELLECLESKIEHKPVRLPRQPIKIKVPERPRLKKPSYTPSAAYWRVQEDFDQEIAKNRSAKKKIKKARGRKDQRRKLLQNNKILVSRRDNALERIMLSEINPERAKAYRKEVAKVEEWEAQKETLANEVKQKNSESTSRYNSELRKYKQYSDSKAPTLYRIVNNLRKECEGLTHGTTQAPVQNLPWKFLERDALSEDVILSKLRSYKKRNPKLIIEEARLKYSWGLKPSAVYVGMDEFDGYFAFLYDGSASVLMENPIRGNAAYIFREDWKRLSRLSKKEINNYHRNKTTKVVHKSGWENRIKSALGI